MTPQQTLGRVVDEGLKTLVAEIQTELRDSGLMTQDEIVRTLDSIGYVDVASECRYEWDMPDE